MLNAVTGVQRRQPQRKGGYYGADDDGLHSSLFRGLKMLRKVENKSRE